MSAMKIAAPISSLSEVEMLLQCGADELYCGVNTIEWDEHFAGGWWMNRRDPSNANFFRWEDFQEAVNKAHTHDVPVHITLNSPFYPAGSIRYLMKLVDKLINDLSIDSLIVSDVNLLRRLLGENLPLRIHLSSLGSCLNSRTADYFASLGVCRIILPRQLKLSEIRRLIHESTVPVEFEVFAVNDGCYFEEGFCQTSHALGPFCLNNWEISSYGSDDPSVSANIFADRQKELQTYMWYQNNCGSSCQEDGLPNGPCSLCWFADFRSWGVAAVKIVGREASFFRKMRSLQLVKAVMDEVRSEASEDSIAELARSLRKTPEYCEKGYMCYFREN